MYKYLVKVDGKGIIMRTLDREGAEKRARQCVPQANARVITVPEAR